MSCEHEVRFTIKPTDDACRFHFDVRAYKDRIVAPDEYSGATVVTPSHIEQVLPTTDKLVREDITINPAPTDDVALNGNTLAEIKAQMLDCATNGGWFHLCTHMYQWGDDLSRVTEILQYANELGMKNVTISGGLSYWRDIYRLYDLF